MTWTAPCMIGCCRWHPCSLLAFLTITINSLNVCIQVWRKIDSNTSFCPECSSYNNTCILWVAQSLLKPKMHPSCMVTSPLQVQKGVINSSVEGTSGQPSSTKGMWEERISSHPLLEVGFPMIGVEYKSSILASVWGLRSCVLLSVWSNLVFVHC